MNVPAPRPRFAGLLSFSLLAIAVATAGSASAQSYDSRYDRGYDGRYDSRTDIYDYARVVRVDPVIVPGYGSRDTAQRCYERPADDVYARDDGYYEGDRYYGGNDGYARDGYRSDSGRNVATVIGGIAGAVLGSQVGGGSGRIIGTAVGTMAGGAAGRSIYDANNRNRVVERGRVRVCDPVPYSTAGGGYDDDGRVQGYDVTYEYAGRSYHTRTSYHPGDRIRVRVDVRPE